MGGTEAGSSCHGNREYCGDTGSWKERALAQRTGLSLRTGAGASSSGPWLAASARGPSVLGVKRPVERTPWPRSSWPTVKCPRARSQVPRPSTGTALG